MYKLNINIPSGMRDMLYDEAILEAEVLARLESVYKKEGFSKVITPTLEYYDAFNFTGQPLPQENMYKLTDNAGRLLVLRPDCTTPIARVAATKLKDMQRPLKLSYSQNVYRVNHGYSGKRNEIMQSGVELIGLDGIKSDIMCITTAVKALDALGADFKIEIGHVEFYNALIAELDMSDEQKEIVRDYVDSKNAVSLGFIEDTAGIEKIMQIPLLFGGKEVFDRARKIAGDNTRALGALEIVKKTYTLLEEAGYGDRILIDLGLVHKLDYYTGIVFRGFIDGAGEPVLHGGRYNNLISNFGCDVPSIGFAISVGAVTDTLYKSEKNRLDPEVADSVIFFDSESFPVADKVRREKEAAGETVEMSCFESEATTREYAIAKGIKKLITVLDGEIKSEEQI